MLNNLPTKFRSSIYFDLDEFYCIKFIEDHPTR